MFSHENIIHCIDLARQFSEQKGSKDSKFYEKGFLANVFGIYTKTYYPKENEIQTIVQLWHRFAPKYLSDIEKAKLLTEWTRLLGIKKEITPEIILNEVAIIRQRQKEDYAKGRDKGIYYSFMDPFNSIVRELNKL